MFATYKYLSDALDTDLNSDARIRKLKVKSESGYWFRLFTFNMKFINVCYI